MYNFIGPVLNNKYFWHLEPNNWKSWIHDQTQAIQIFKAIISQRIFHNFLSLLIVGDTATYHKYVYFILFQNVLKLNLYISIVKIQSNKVITNSSDQPNLIVPTMIVFVLNDRFGLNLTCFDRVFVKPECSLIIITGFHCIGT